MRRWSILPSYLVRLAGFAFERLAALRCSRALAAAEALAAASSAREAAGRALDEALGQERYADNPAFDDPAIRKVLSRHVKQARAFARRLAADVPVPAEALREVARVVPKVAALADELARTHTGWQDAARAYETTFEADFEQAREALRRMYQDDERLREAVFLESPEAFERIQQLIASPGPRNARARQRERLAAMYAQRFCAKNDTNSICGPHGVGYVTRAGAVPEVEVVAEDVRRETYFSHWAAQSLLDEAVRRAADPSLVTYRLHPMVRVEDGVVAWCAVDYDGTTFRRRHMRSALPGPAAELLKALAPACSEADLIARGAELELEADEVMSFVEELVGAGALLRGPVVPPGLFYPLRAVTAEVERWPESETRTWALAEIGAIEGMVAAFARAKLPERLELHRQLNMRFTEATGSAATRGEGRHGADRAVLHEDCYVEVRSDLGTPIAALEDAIQVLGSVLELPIELLRERVHEWFRARFGEGKRVAALDVHRAFDEDRVLETAAATPRAAALRTAIEGVREAIARGIAASDGGPVRIPAGELRRTLEGVPPPGHASYMTIDVMPRRFPDGHVELLISEVHAGFGLTTCLFDILPPDHRERVTGHMTGAAREMARGRKTAEGVFLHTQATDRRVPVAESDVQMLNPSDRRDAFDISALDVRLTGDDIEFLKGDEEIIPFLPYNRYQFVFLTSRFAPVFDHHTDRFFPDALLPDALRVGDVPRLGIDNVVFQRHFLRRPVSAVRALLAATSEAELFRNAQVLKRELGLGQLVFVSLTGEPKPVLLDFHNVFLLEAFANMLERQADDAVARFSEIMPGPDELIAKAPDGLRTSELRMGFHRVLGG